MTQTTKPERRAIGGGGDNGGGGDGAPLAQMLLWLHSGLVRAAAKVSAALRFLSKSCTLHT